jgi:hypothetical protein
MRRWGRKAAWSVCAVLFGVNANSVSEKAARPCPQKAKQGAKAQG